MSLRGLFSKTHLLSLKSKTGLMVARAAALRTNINIDGRPLPTQKRRRTSEYIGSQKVPRLLRPSAPSYKRPYSPSPLRALVSSEYSNKHHHHHPTLLTYSCSYASSYGVWRPSGEGVGGTSRRCAPQRGKGIVGYQCLCCSTHGHSLH